MILDSGNRTEYPTGAVRDIKEGKGRCDLMPLDIVGEFMDDEVIEFIYDFQQDNSKIVALYAVLEMICQRNYEEFENVGTIRKSNMLLDVSVHFEEGAKKYGEHNWQKGIPVQSYIDSAVRHYLKHLRGDNDENHLRAFIWNILCCIWTVKHKEELGVE